MTAVLVLTSWLIETPREAVERTLYELAATVEANDVKGALSYLAPSADPQLRKDVETLMPLVRIDRARIIGTPEIDIEGGANINVGDREMPRRDFRGQQEGRHEGRRRGPPRPEVGRCATSVGCSKATRRRRTGTGPWVGKQIVVADSQRVSSNRPSGRWPLYWPP